MQYQVHKFFPYAVRCFPAYFSWTKHPAVKANVTRRKKFLYYKILVLCTGSSIHMHIHTWASAHTHTHTLSHTHTHTRTYYIKSLVFHLHILSVPAPVTFRTARLLICAFSAIQNFFKPYLTSLSSSWHIHKSSPLHRHFTPKIVALFEDRVVFYTFLPAKSNNQYVKWTGMHQKSFYSCIVCEWRHEACAKYSFKVFSL